MRSSFNQKPSPAPAPTQVHVSEVERGPWGRVVKRVRAVDAWRRVSLSAALYGGLSCTITPMLGHKRVSQWAMRRWFVSICTDLGIGRELRNGVGLEAQRPCVFVANHLSLLDTVLIGSFMTGDYRWLAKEDVFKVPIIGHHLRCSGHIPVYRGTKRGSNVGLPEQIHQVVAEGASLLFYPEGTRSRDGRLQAFKMGAFIAAVEEALPVVPLVVEGTDQLLRKGEWAPDLARNVVCRLTVLPPQWAPAAGDARARAEALRDAVRAAMLAQLGGEDGQAAAARHAMKAAP